MLVILILSEELWLIDVYKRQKLDHTQFSWTQQQTSLVSISA